jgi:hypothetical protein
MTNINDNLKLYYTFGRETLDFTNEYLVKNVKGTNDYAKLSNPLCISSKNTFLSDMSFMCSKEIMLPESQLGTLTIPSITLNEGFYVFFWLNVMKVDNKIFNLFNIQIKNEYSIRINHDNKNFIVEINFNGSNSSMNLIEFSINTKYLFGIKFNNNNGRFLININGNNIFFSENFLNTNINTSQTYKNITFGSDDDEKCAYFYLNEIRLYNSLNDELVSLIYNNGSGVKPTLFFDLNIQLSREIIGLNEEANITFNTNFTRLPLNYELCLYCNKKKISYLKDSINASNILTDNLGINNSYSNEQFIKLIYVSSSNNTININNKTNGIKIIDVQDVDAKTQGLLDLTDDAVNNNYFLVELSDNSIYMGLLETDMSVTPSVLNNFTTGKQSTNIIFNGNETEKIYNIYTYKFSDNNNIYYYLDKTPQNKIDNFNLQSFIVENGKYSIYAEFITEKYNIIQSNTVNLVVKSQQKQLKISGTPSIFVNDYGIIKLEQETPINNNVTTVMVKNNTNNSQIAYNLEKDQSIFVFTPNVTGTYYISAKREAEGYGPVLSNTISVLVYDGKQDTISLSADPIITFPNNILLTVNETNIPAATRLFYKHSSEDTFNNIKMEALSYPFKPLKIGSYSFYASRKLVNFKDVSSNIINVSVIEGNQEPITINLDKTNISYGENLGIIINQTNRLSSSKTILEINYENKKIGWEEIITFYNLPSSYYYYKINGTGNATIRLTNVSSLYSNFILTKNIVINKLDQPNIKLEYQLGSNLIKTGQQTIESFFAENVKYPIQNNTININYDSDVQLFLSNLTFLSALKLTQDNNNIIIKQNDTSINIYGSSAGTTKLIIKKSGNDIYTDLVIELQIIVNKINQPKVMIGIEGLNNINNNYVITINRNKIYNFVISKFFENASIIFSSNSQSCKISGNTIVPFSAGTCQIVATLTETNNYLETKSVPIIVTVIKNIQNELVYNNIPSISVGNRFDLIVNGGTTNNDVVLNTLTPELCSIYGLTNVKASQTGNCIIKATKSGDYLYDDKDVNISFNINKSPQPKTNIIIENLTKVTNNNYDYGLIIDSTKTYTLILNGVLGNPSNIQYVSSDPNICAITGNILKTNKTGFCNVKAIIPETPNYLASESSLLNINVIKRSQVDFAIGSMPDVYFGDTISVPITGGTLSGEIILSSDTSNNCVIQNNKILTTNAGTCSITAFMDGNDIFDSISKKGINIKVNKKSQPNLNVVIQNSQIDQSNNIIYLPINREKPYNIEPTGLLESSIVIYQLSNVNALNPALDVCKIQNNKIFAYSEGTCDLIIFTTETNNYLASTSQPIKISVIKSIQNDLNFGEIPSLNYNNTITLNITGGSGTGQVLLNSDSTNCTTKGLTVTGKNTGQCTITATNLGDDTYLPKSVKKTINVNRILQPILSILITDLLDPVNKIQDTNGNSILKVNRDKTYSLSLSGYMENPNITFNIINNFSQNQDPVCTISGNLLTAYSEGSCLIEGNYSETQNYTSGKTKPIIISVIKTEQSDFILNTTPTFYYNNPTLIDLNGGSSTNLINFQSKTLSTCTISDNIVFSKDIGDCNITATKPGGYFYYDKVKDYNFKILQEFQPPIDIIIEGKKSDLEINIDTLPTIFAKNKLSISNETGNNSFKNGDYLISSSSIGNTNNDAYNVFRKQLVTSWISENNTYESITGNYIKKTVYTGVVGGNMLFGEWVQIQLPYNLKITSSNILNSFPNLISKCPQIFHIAGSIDGFTWYLLSSQNFQTMSEEKTPLSFNISTNSSFSYYRLIISKLRGGDNNSTNINLLQWNIQGIYSNNTYTISVDRNQKFNLKLQNIQDNATYTLSAISNYSLEPNEPVLKLEDNNKMIGYNSGVCVLQANINKTNKYLSSISNPLIIVVMKKEAVAITTEPIPPLYYGSNVEIKVKTGSNLQFKTLDPKNCIVSGTTITGIQAGKCIVNVKEPETRETKGVELDLSLTVLKVEQTNFKLVFDNQQMDLSDNITFNIDRNREYILSISGLIENPKITYNITTNYSLDPNEPVVKINENKLIAYNAGVCLIQADISETINYKATKTSPIVITVNKNKQQALNYDVNSLIYSKNSKLSIGGGSTKNNINVQAQPKSQKNCQVKNLQQFVSNEVSYGTYDVNGIYTGDCKLSATKTGDYNYEDAQINIPLVVNRNTQPPLSISVTLEPQFSQNIEGFNNINDYDDFSSFAPF